MRRFLPWFVIVTFSLSPAWAIGPGELIATGVSTETPSQWSSLDNPIFEQFGESCRVGAPSQQFPEFGDSVLQSADDFTVHGTQTLNQVIALGQFSTAGGAFDSITIEVYDSDGPGNVPGTLLCSETGLANAGGANDPDIDVALNGSCTLEGGTYWLSVFPVMPYNDGVTGQWFWKSYGPGYGSEFVFRDPDNLIGSPCQEWGLGRSQCGIGSYFAHLCFGVGALPPAVPALTWTSNILLAVLLAVGLLVAVTLRQRRGTVS